MSPMITAESLLQKLQTIPDPLNPSKPECDKANLKSLELLAAGLRKVRDARIVAIKADLRGRDEEKDN
jgi:hypothetical protein